MAKVKRMASSVNEVSRAEASKESKAACFRVRGKASASVRVADRQKVRRTQAARRKGSICEGRMKGRWKNAEFTVKGIFFKRKRNWPARSSKAKSYLWGYGSVQCQCVGALHDLIDGQGCAS